MESAIIKTQQDANMAMICPYVTFQGSAESYYYVLCCILFDVICYRNDQGQSMWFLPSWSKTYRIFYCSFNKQKYVVPLKISFCQLIIIHLDSPYRDNINTALLQLHKEGVISNLERKWFPSNLDCSLIEQVQIINWWFKWVYLSYHFNSLTNQSWHWRILGEPS